MKIKSIKNEFGESYSVGIIDFSKSEELKIFDGKIGLKFYSKEQYADEFIQGKFQTRQIN